MPRKLIYIIALLAIFNFAEAQIFPFLNYNYIFSDKSPKKLLKNQNNDKFKEGLKNYQRSIVQANFSGSIGSGLVVKCSKNKDNTYDCLVVTTFHHFLPNPQKMPHQQSIYIKFPNESGKYPQGENLFIVSDPYKDIILNPDDYYSDPANDLFIVRVRNLPFEPIVAPTLKNSEPGDTVFPIAASAVFGEKTVQLTANNNGCSVVKRDKFQVDGNIHTLCLATGVPKITEGCSGCPVFGKDNGRPTTAGMVVAGSVDKKTPEKNKMFFVDSEAIREGIKELELKSAPCN